jgi:rhamnose transport system substrate-binding protein
VAAVALVATTLGMSSASAAPSALKKGLKVFVIPKNLGNSYFTTADSVKSQGALYALKQLGEIGQETSGTTDTPSSQLPIIQADISKGANALVISATDPLALCPTLNAAMKKGITVVTYDSDAPTCRSLFVNQATPQGIGDSQVDILASEIHDSGQIAIVSASASDTNQNTWIMYMKQELKKFPKMSLATIVYGNDDTATSTEVTQGLVSRYPDLKGIISPTSIGLPAAAAVLDTSQYRGKIALTGLATPNEMKKYVADGTVKEFVCWNPANLGYLAAYAAVELASGAIKAKTGVSFIAGKLGKYTIVDGHTIVLGLPFIFTKSNINQFNF